MDVRKEERRRWMEGRRTGEGGWEEGGTEKMDVRKEERRRWMGEGEQENEDRRMAGEDGRGPLGTDPRSRRRSGARPRGSL